MIKKFICLILLLLCINCSNTDKDINKINIINIDFKYKNVIGISVAVPL